MYCKFTYCPIGLELKSKQQPKSTVDPNREKMKLWKKDYL